MMLGMDMMGGGRRLPRNGLLLYLARPNSDEYLVGEDTEIGEDTYIWGYVLPDDADIRAATGWESGTANVFYDATGTPIVALATEIDRAVLPENVAWHLTNETQQTGRLAIYTAATAWATIEKARSVLRDDSIDHLFFGTTGIWYDPQDLASMYQDAGGTLPVYRPGTGLVDPPVGLMLDKSQGLELGPELADEVWAPVPPWVADGGNTFSCVNCPHSTGVYQSNSEEGKAYRFVWSINNISAGGVRVLCSGKYSSTKTTVGTYTTDMFASESAPYFGFYSAGVTTASISVHSVREIKGDHAYQPTTTARPTLSGRYNLLTATETLSTQSVTTAATDYTLSFSGTGTITLSGTATGTLSAGTHTITCTEGSLTCTVAGSVTRADLRVKRDGSSLPAYQSVTNANTYDTVGFPLFIKRDKVDDELIVQAPAIDGTGGWASIDTVDIASTTITAGEYKPFGVISTGEATCTQWVAIDGTLTASEQAALSRYLYDVSLLPEGA